MTITKTMGLFSRLNLSKPDSRRDSQNANRGDHPAGGSSARSSSGNGHHHSRLEDLERLETLGTGTFGRVRLVQHRDTKRFYALKILLKSEIIRMKQVEHVLNEKTILNQIKHPFIVNLYASYQNRKHLFMLMEYVPGGEMFSHLRRAGRFSDDTARFFAGSIVLAVQYMHSKDIVYRDLKPENLLLDQKGNLKITDFGFAKMVTDRTWTLCGTPEYLAPEIIQSKGHGKGVDWWALGVLIYEMLAGYPPFYDENPFDIYQKILVGKIDFPRHFNPYAKDLVRKLCTGDRTKRFGNLRNGAEDIKKHKWFKGFDFDLLVQGAYRPPVVPDVRCEGDTRNFEKYEETEEDDIFPLVDEDTDKRMFGMF